MKSKRNLRPSGSCSLHKNENMLIQLEAQTQMAGAERQPRQQEHVWSLKINYEYLGDTLDTQHGLLAWLFSKDVLGNREKQDIECEKTDYRKNEVLVNIILNRPASDFQLFLQALEETNQKHVADRIKGQILVDATAELSNSSYHQVLDSERGALEVLDSEEIEDKHFWRLFIEGQKVVIGLCSLENKICVICHQSSYVFVYSDQHPFNRIISEEFELPVEPGKYHIYDMTACRKSRTVFVSDKANKCLWKVQMPEKHILKCPVDGKPYRLSSSHSGDLLILLRRDPTNYLETFAPSDMSLITSISFPVEFKRIMHAVSSSNGNFIISYGDKLTDKKNCREPGKGWWKISEVSIDGTVVLTFDPTVDRSILLKWPPKHLAIDENDNIFIVDRYFDKVLLLNNKLTKVKVVLSSHHIKEPSRLCYVREKRQLIVGQGCLESIDPPGSLSLFTFSYNC